MTEEEAKNNPEMKVILILSGYIRELGEGKGFEKATCETAKKIVKIFSMPTIIKSLPLTGKRRDILEKTYNRLLSEEPTKLNIC